MGDIAKSDLTASYGAEFFLQQSGAPTETFSPLLEPPPSNMQAYAATEKISSGSYFGRSMWDVIASDKEQTRNAGGLADREGSVDYDYALTRQVVLLSTAGYEAFDATPPLTRNINGIVALGGVRIALGPAFEFQVRAGRQYNAASYTGNLHYEINPAMSLAGGISDTVTTPAHLLLDNLENLTATDQGTLYDNNYELSNDLQSAFSAFNTAFGLGSGLSNTIQRYQTAKLSLLYETSRTHLRLTGFGVEQDILSPLPFGIDPHEMTYGVTALASRDFTRRLTGTIDTTYSIEHIFSGHDDILNTGGSLSYKLNPLMSVYVRANYLTRLTSQSLITLSPEGGNLSTAEFRIGIQRQLF
jgi:hypothetical protein